jgi:ferrous iron transport protein A
MTLRSLVPNELTARDDAESGPRLLLGLRKARHLGEMKAGESARIVELTMEGDLAAWLRAVGVGEGEEVEVLRHAAFGGPIHVRTSAGGEFALNRALAQRILVRATAGGKESAA